MTNSATDQDRSWHGYGDIHTRVWSRRHKSTGMTVAVPMPSASAIKSGAGNAGPAREIH